MLSRTAHENKTHKCSLANTQSDIANAKVKLGCRDMMRHVHSESVIHILENAAVASMDLSSLYR